MTGFVQMGHIYTIGLVAEILEREMVSFDSCSLQVPIQDPIASDLFS